jgi:hypothetical protein
MIRVYITLALIFVGFLLAGDNPLAQPVVWILGLVAAIHLFRARATTAENATMFGETGLGDIRTGTTRPSSDPELDMFFGLRGWTEQDCAPEVAAAACSLSGRNDIYMRALLVAATLRQDEAGKTVAAAARRVLRGAKQHGNAATQDTDAVV